MTCTYTFNTKDGPVTLKGMGAMKAFLALNGEAAIMFSRAVGTKQTDTPEFKRWFGESKVRQPMTSSKQKFADMPPLVVYHATNADFSSFESGRATVNSTTFGDDETERHGIFFAEDPSFAEAYIRNGGGGNVLPVYLSIQNPLYLYEGISGEDLSAIMRHADRSKMTERDFYFIEPHQWWGAFDGEFGKEFVRAAQAAGFDGAQMVERDPDGVRDDNFDVWVAFRPEQIKSAIGNQGTFDPNDPDIRRSVRGGGPVTPPPSVGGGFISKWLVDKDEMGRLRVAGLHRVGREVAERVGNALDIIRLKPMSKEMSEAIRRMKADIQKAHDKTAKVAERLVTVSEADRQMISDIIEGELTAGVNPTKEILNLATSMSQIMSEQSAELVRLGMLSQETVNRWENKYLPRFYESSFRNEAKDWAKAVRAMLRPRRAMEGIKGDSQKARGIFQPVPAEDLQDWLDQGWELRDNKYQPGKSKTARVWRDYTREEREKMGEVRDAMFRFVIGYMRTQKDIAVGNMYQRIADTMARDNDPGGFVQVPDTKVEGTMAYRYGALAGMWVPREVLDHLSHESGKDDEQLMKLYRKGLSMWKESKTVLNPTAHVNNIVSNVTLAHFAGVSYWDWKKYAAATRDLVKNADMVKEAREAGLFTGTVRQEELVSMLPDQLKVLAAKVESKTERAIDTTFNAMAFMLRKPLGMAYESEDLFFRYLIYRDARQSGMSPEDAVEYTTRYIFTYDDLPQGARAIRDFPLGMPFFSWTYKFIPAFFHTATAYPHRLLAPATILYGVNAAMYALAYAAADGDDDDDWMEILKRYVTDPEYRKQVSEFESGEREKLPEWEKGYSSIGTPKVIRLGTDELTNLPVFMNISRFMPGGDLGDFTSNAGGAPLPQWATPNNPIFTMTAAAVFNKDAFRGRPIMEDTNTRGENAKAFAGFMYQQMAPAISPGSYHFDRWMNGIANMVDRPIQITMPGTDKVLVEYTGIDKQGQPVQPKYAAMQTFGVKARPIDLDESEKMAADDKRGLANKLDRQITRIKKLAGKGFMSDDRADQEIEKLQRKKALIKSGLTVNDNLDE